MNTSFNQTVERIICPYDFSPTGSAGLDYAGTLCAALGASLTIFYVQPSIWPEALQLYDDLNDDNRAIRRLVHLEAQRIESAFGIKCDYVIEPTIDTSEVAVGAMSVDYDLIVMGSNGADELYQHVFGTDSHHILGLAKCPVLIIPGGYQAAVPRQIVYAADPDDKTIIVNHLESLSNPLKAEVRTLNVTGDMRSFDKESRSDQSNAGRYSDKVVSYVDNYMKENKADLLALTYHHRSLFDKLFLADKFKDLGRIADYPILVFWH